MTPARLTIALALAASVGVAPIAAQSTAPAGQSAPAAKPGGTSAKQETTAGRLQLKNLPPQVRATVEAETRNATLKGLSREKEHGKTVYEVESLVNGRTRDLMIDAAGKVYEIEEQLDVAQAPAPVKSALEAKGQIVALESVTTNGKTHYEGVVKTKTGRKMSFDLDATGTAIAK